MRRVWCTAAALAAGCLKPNPGFDVADSDSAGTGASTGANTTAVPTTTTTTSPTTGSATTEADTSTATSLPVSTTGVPPDMSSGTTDGTTGEPANCWGLGLDAWTVEALPLDPSGGSPMLSPDAKVLHWRALLNNEWHVIRAARDDVTLPFPPGTSTWPANDFAADYPAFVAGTQELFFAGLGDIYVMPRDGDVWGVPTVAGGVQAFGGAQETHPNPTADGATLLFQRDDGPGFGQFNVGYNFYQVSRDPEVHPTFPDVAPLKVTPTDPGFGIAACPALAPDGLRLFFGGFDSLGGGLGDPNDGRAGVWFGERDSVGAGSWIGLTRSDQLREQGFVTCPVAVSADGCQLTLALFTIGPGTYETRLARRG